MANSNKFKSFKHKKRNMGGPPMGGAPMSFDKPKDIKKTLKKLLKYIGKYKIGILIVLIFSVGSTISAIVGPNILGNATTELFNGLMRKINGSGGIDFGKISGILLTLVVLYVASLIFGCFQGFVMSSIAQKLCYRLRGEMCEKLEHLPMKFFDKHVHGEILSIVTNDIDTLGQSLNQSLIQVVTSATMLIGILIMMFTISWILTLTALILIPVSFGIISLIVKKSQKYFKDQQDYLGHVNGQVEEIFSGENIVKAFNNQKEVEGTFKDLNDTLFKSAWKSQFLSGLMMPIMQFIGNIGYAMVAVLGGYLAIKQTITVGNIQSFIQYIRMFTQPITQFAQITNMLQSTAAAAERVFVFLDEKEEEQELEVSVKSKDIIGNVQFAHVYFGYSSDKIIINDFSATINQGEKVAIVGPTGAGKTTIVKLLMRFYELEEGAILIDGYDIRQFYRNDLRKKFGMVLQETWLFNGTIMDNIRYGKLDATDEEVIEAAKAAHVDHFVRTLSDGYNTILEEDATNISQGQRQLLTIARAVLADPKVLILDEATSSVDTRTEVLIQKAMDKLMKGRTSFVIAHRLSTIKDADKIFVMNNGDIVEQGNHEQLLKKDGFYAKLYNSQFDSIDKTA